MTPEGGFNPTWQRHVAAYALSAEDLGSGPVLDLGCGVGHSYDRLAPRDTVGIDLDPSALTGQERETIAADMRDLPLDDHSFESVLSVHSLEHVPDPGSVLDEVARVLRPEGTAVFVTPNRLTFGRPDEIIDPFHYVEFDRADLRELCRHRFAEVEIRGVFGSDRYMTLFDRERATLERLLRLDPLRLRRLVPMKTRQRLYDRMLNHFRADAGPEAAAIEPEDFHLGNDDLDGSLDLVAICRVPIAPSAWDGAGDRRRGNRGPAGKTSPPDWPGSAATACVWCREPLGSGAERRPGRTFCTRCGTGTTDPVPTQSALDAAYGDWYWPADDSRFSLVGDHLLRRSRASMADRIDAIAPPGPVLDVGAGEGTLIEALESRGRSARGLERDSDRPEIENLPIGRVEGSFAAVVFWHSLEHLGDPKEAVESAARLLEPGGFIVIAVPDVSSLQAAVFGDRWLHLDLPRHLVHLTGDGLAEGLTEAGFTVRRVSRTRAGQVVIGWLDGLVGRLPGDLNLYQSLRRRSARRIEVGPVSRAAAIAAGVVLFPVALACSGFEILRNRSGTVYVEAQIE